jgi:putative membrane protein
VSTTAALAAALPGVNAALNALSGALALAGYLAIRRGARVLHRRLMLGAVATSALFLAGYLGRLALTGVHRFPGTGALRAAYLAVLGSHTLLAALAAPLVLVTLALALRARFAVHRRLARVTLPIWLYVSATGVAVYVLLYRVAGVS